MGIAAKEIISSPSLPRTLKNRIRGLRPSRTPRIRSTNLRSYEVRWENRFAYGKSAAGVCEAAKDPILFNGGQWNLYAYLSNDPLNETDPAGLGVVVPVPPGVDPGEFQESIESSLTCPGMVSGSSNFAGKTVREILKGKKGSILQAPLKPGTPSWGELMNETWEQLLKMAKENPNIDTVIKLLRSNRFNK